MNPEIKCPKCGELDSIQEVYNGATVLADVLSISEDDITTSDLRIMDTAEFYYHCYECGSVIAYSADELYEVLTGASSAPEEDEEYE